MSEFIYDVGQDDFEEKIVLASNDKAVVVDFWAEWCAPCKMLGPLLEKVIESFGGRAVLAKVNVDLNQQLAAAFGIRSIPTVKIVRNGSIVQEFVGAQPEERIRSLIEPFLGAAKEEGVSTPEQLIAEKRYDEARAVYNSVLETEPDNGGALVGLARIDIQEGNTESAKLHLSAVDELAPEFAEAKALRTNIEFFDVCKTVENKGELEKLFRENPGDLDNGYRLGCCYAAEGKYEKALDIFFAIVKKNRNYNDGKAREAMVSLFATIGPESKLTQDYRQRLANELF